MSFIPQHPWRPLISAEEYLRLRAHGFVDGARLELMDGEIIEMGCISSEHAAVVNALNRLMVLAARERALVSAQNPLIVTSYSVPQPDVLLLRPREDRYFNSHPTADDVLLVIEVADASLRFDLERKIPAYGRSGIAEAWVVDLKGRVLRVFTGPERGVGYTSDEIIGASYTASPEALPDLEIGIADLFPY